jgi:hypothetical protein
MKPSLEVPKNEIETEAENHAEETRLAVAHRDPPNRREDRTTRATTRPATEEPWQID